MNGDWLDFGDGHPDDALTVDEWIREVGDDDITERLNNPFCIDKGKPKLCEGQALFNFFPRLSRGIPCKNGRHLLIEAGNLENPYGPDLVLRFPEHRPDRGIAFIDVERKTRDQIFLSSDLPINVPVLTMSAHKGLVPYQWADGSWRKSGKMRYFEAYPDTTFFLAVAPDGLVAFLVTGRDIIECEPEWIAAKGPFQEFGTDPDRRIGEILVARVPRSCAVRGTASHHDIENAIMNCAAVRAAVTCHADPVT